MSQEIQKKIDVMVKNMNRPQFLAFLGTDDVAIQIGDNECLRPVSASTMDRFAVHKDNVPFLENIGGDCCARAIVRRYDGRSSVGVPCFATGLDENETFCDVCKDIWPEHDDNGFYVLDTEVMPKASEFYKPAKTAVLWLCGCSGEGTGGI